MKNKFFFTLAVFLFVIQPLNLLSASSPKREFRAVWIATVKNYDWPTSLTLTAAQQKQNMIAMLDNMKQAGYNAVIFQVRPESDALYNSAIEPWSYWLTGAQGTSPGYDPLEFVIREAHKRGMELHAWFNPFRTASLIGRYPAAQNHISVTKPEWNLTVSTIKMLDPGLQEVRSYVTSVIADVVRRYDIDGVHFDDYFYPYEIITTQDNGTFAAYPRGFSNQGDWRRDNVNIFVKQVHDTVLTLKPYIKFGISPFGIWKSGVPAGITGLNAYTDIYCDAFAWVNQKAVDYLMPQLYWGFGGSQDYAKLEPWWGDSIKAASNECHYYPGLGLYRLEDGSLNLATIVQQIQFSRDRPKTDGTVHFRALMVQNNQRKIFDTLTTGLYRYPSLPPVMNWKDIVSPNPPQNVRLELDPVANLSLLKWDLPALAADGDSAVRYVVYRKGDSPIAGVDFEDSQNIFTICGEKETFVSPIDGVSGPSYFAVTSLDRNNNESVLSGNVSGNVNSIATVNLLSPLNGENAGRSSDQFRWNAIPGATSYFIQFSLNQNFDPASIFVSTTIGDTSCAFTATMTGQTTCYWRVAANVGAGHGPFSAVRNFITGWPTIVTLVQPASAQLNVALNPVFIWNKNSVADSYRLQIAKPPKFDTTTIIVDTIIVTDTTYALQFSLAANSIYYWRVQPINSFGIGSWPAAQYYAFKTVAATGVAESSLIPLKNELQQNYPNPFNPTTNFGFRISDFGFVKLSIFDLLGREVAVLINEQKQAGRYTVNWNASGISSGMYFYRLEAGSYISTKKLVLLR